MNLRANTIILAFLLTVSQPVNLSQAANALPEGALPDDSRLEPLKDLNGYFPFDVPNEIDEWNKRAAALRNRILVSEGLWPMPVKTPLNPVVHGKRDMGDYTVEKVYFESFPGFYVTGNLYRPKGTQGKVPGVLSPHGHWSQGRFYDRGHDGVLNDIVQGAERFEIGGRNPLQARCVQLARMGCAVFHYDMIGYADSVQIGEDVAHRFSKQRPEMNTLEDWGLFSAQAEARLQSVMGLQTWNSIRALDFLSALPDVDSSRIAVTGASGGGTQTFILGAIDPRPSVLFPAVMVSTAMQGGCTCENASLLRVGTGNVEIAGLIAPRPLGLTAADDWTVEMETKGFPELKRLYGLHQKPNHAALTALTHFGHNYNYVSRAAMYPWMNRHLNLGLKEPIVEEDYDRLTREELTVWTTDTKPEGGPEVEKRILRHWNQDASTQIKSAANKADEGLALLEPAFDILVGRAYEDAGTVEWELVHKLPRDGYLEMSGLLKNKTYSEELPALFLHPEQWNRKTVLWISREGKGSLLDENNRPVNAVQRLLDQGYSVGSIDLLYQGEFLGGGEPPRQTRKVENNREFAGYTFGYNHSLFARRVHDILTLVRFVRHDERQSDSVSLAGLEGAGHWVAAALTQLDGHVDSAVLDSGGFRFGKLLDYRHPDFLPGGAKYLDLPGMLATVTQTRVAVVDQNDYEAVRNNRRDWPENSLKSRIAKTSATSDYEWIAWLEKASK